MEYSHGPFDHLGSFALQKESLSPSIVIVQGPLKNPNPRGKLYLYHLDRPRSSSSLASKRNPYPLSLEGFPNNKDFHPLGIELFARDSQSARLFVANHRRDRSVIDVFELSAKDGDQIELLWSRTLTHSLINTPNSIVALSLNSLLVTNDHFMNRRQLGPIGPLLHTIEKFAHLPGGNVIALEFDEHHRTSSSETARVVAGGIAFANGLALTNDRATLIVASSTTRRLLFYRALPGSTQLAFTYVGARALPFGPDNLSINAEDELVVAGHPNVPRFMLWLLYPKRFPPAGSTIMRLNLREEVHDVSQLSVTNVFKDDGWFFATSSTGLLLGQGSKRRLIASGLYHHGLLECLGDEKA